MAEFTPRTGKRGRKPGTMDRRTAQALVEIDKRLRGKVNTIVGIAPEEIGRDKGYTGTGGLVRLWARKMGVTVTVQQDAKRPVVVGVTVKSKPSGSLPASILKVAKGEG